jgi:hypothetical protein
MDEKKEAVDPQAKDKKAPGREKQPEGLKRITVMIAGVAHSSEVQAGSLVSDVLAQFGVTGKKLSKTEGGTGAGLKPTDKIFEHVNDTDTLYVT